MHVKALYAIKEQLESHLQHKHGMNAMQHNGIASRLVHARHHSPCHVGRGLHNCTPASLTAVHLHMQHCL